MLEREPVVYNTFLHSGLIRPINQNGKFTLVDKVHDLCDRSLFCQEVVSSFKF